MKDLREHAAPWIPSFVFSSGMLSLSGTVWRHKQIKRELLELKWGRRPWAWPSHLPFPRGASLDSPVSRRKSGGSISFYK
jgi:hypothetical protein